MIYFFFAYIVIWVGLFAYLYFLKDKVAKVETRLEALEKKLRD